MAGGDVLVPLYLSEPDTCARLGIGRERLRALARQGDIVPVGVTIDGRPLYRPADVDRLGERLAARGVGRLAALRKVGRAEQNTCSVSASGE